MYFNSSNTGKELKNVIGEESPDWLRTLNHNTKRKAVLVQKTAAIKKKPRRTLNLRHFRFLPAKGVMPAAGLEPAVYPQQILSLHRLPFRHAGLPHSGILF